MSQIKIALHTTRTVFSSLPPGALQGPTLAAAVLATACVALAVALPGRSARSVPALPH